MLPNARDVPPRTTLCSIPPIPPSLHAIWRGPPLPHNRTRKTRSRKQESSAEYDNVCGPQISADNRDFWGPASGRAICGLLNDRSRYYVVGPTTDARPQKWIHATCFARPWASTNLLRLGQHVVHVLTHNAGHRASRLLKLMRPDQDGYNTRAQTLSRRAPQQHMTAGRSDLLR